MSGRWSGGREGDGNLNFLHWSWRLGRSGCNMTWARGQSLWAKVTSLPANGVAAGRLRLGVGNTLPQSPTQLGHRLVRAAIRSVASSSLKGRSAAEEKEYLQRKDQGLPIPLSPRRFSVDNLSRPLRSGELCSRALGQDPGSHPPLGRRRGAGAK